MYRLSPLSPVHLTRYACLMFLPPPFSNYCLNVESERTPRTINLHMGIGLFSRRMPGRHMGPSSLAQLPFCRAHLTDHLVTLPRKLTVAWEWLLYLYGMASATLFDILPTPYWNILCHLVRGMRLMQQYHIP
ncbi:hypothetical protein P692DRAFT_20377454 [Suillus brevipes Sb2]|nr:hypothetical protein P692DRAFT_20377454 [Suillus brevipes Sb2]